MSRKYMSIDGRNRNIMEVTEDFVILEIVLSICYYSI